MRSSASKTYAEHVLRAAREGDGADIADLAQHEATVPGHRLHGTNGPGARVVVSLEMPHHAVTLVLELVYAPRCRQHVLHDALRGLHSPHIGILLSFQLALKVLLVSQKVSKSFPQWEKATWKKKNRGDRNRIKAAQQRWGNRAANGVAEGEECPPAARIISQRVTWKRVG